MNEAASEQRRRAGRARLAGIAGLLAILGSPTMPGRGATRPPTSELHAQPTARPPAPRPGATLAQVKLRGRLRCGVSSALPGFGEIDAKGVWSGFDVDFCRAVAVVTLGDTTKIDFVALDARERFGALADGNVDLLSRNTTWTLLRETTNGILFAGTSYYDGQGFLVRRALNIDTALNLPSEVICVQRDTTTELNLSDFFRQRGKKYAPKIFETAAATEEAYRSGQCGAYTDDAAALFVVRANLPDADAHVILPQIISKEPLGPAVRQGDDQWFLVVRWVLIAMIEAEELGVAQANLDQMAKSDNPRVKRLLGIEGNFGPSLGLSADWAYRIVKFVGNYRDVFERNLGEGSKLKIKRGLNALWTNGGLLYAPPMQ